MPTGLWKTSITVTALLLGLLLANPAAAFRCGNKLVREGMHEQQVVAICGQPATSRNLGYTVRGYALGVREYSGPGWSLGREVGQGRLREEVIITEYVYNFGPRRLMRRLLFEGGVLVSIESIGYGYRDE
jgi:hypothetical protein